MTRLSHPVYTPTISTMKGTSHAHRMRRPANLMRRP
nr:MAG TPA: hypothetical protein [Caudoviricetes sp.]